MTDEFTNNGVKELGEDGVCLRVRGVEADARVEVLHPGLDHVLQTGAEGRSLLGPQSLEHVFREKLFKFRL